MKILVLSSRIPYPLEKGDKLRLYHQLRHLSVRHQIILCCLSDRPMTEDQKAALSPLTQELIHLPLRRFHRMWRMIWAWASRLPFQVVWFTERKAQNLLHQAIERHQPDLIFCQLVRSAEYVKDIHTTPKVIDFMDALSAGMHRRSHAQVGLGKWALRLLLSVEGTRLARYESRVFDYFDACTIISKNDRLLIPHRDRNHIHIVPNGVDLTDFSPPKEKANSDKKVILFSGNMSYAPNVDAAHFLVREILPLLTHPRVEVVLAGAEPSVAVKALAGPQVRVTGWVDDIAAEYRQADLFVAPLRMGTGLQNKVLEAMASALPCVLSPHAFSPLGLPSTGHAKVCQHAKDFAAQIDGLLADPTSAMSMAKKAREVINTHFTWEGQNAMLEQILMDVAHSG